MANGDKKKHSAQDQLDIWNAVLNPPDRPSKIANFVFDPDLLESRNEMVQDWLDASEGWDKDFLKKQIQEFDRGESGYNLIFQNQFEVFDYETDVLATQEKLGNLTAIEHRHKTDADLTKYKDELANELFKKWVEEKTLPSVQIQLAKARQYIDDNLFYDYEYNSETERALRLDTLTQARIAEDIPFNEQSSQRLVTEVSNELQHSPQYMTKNEKFWLAMGEADDAGLFHPDLMDFLSKNIFCLNVAHSGCFILR